MRKLIANIIFLMFLAVFSIIIYVCAFFEWLFLGKQTEKEKAGYY